MNPRASVWLAITFVLAAAGLAQGQTGKATFADQCASCHPVGARSGPSGPTLRGVAWRKIADRRDFAYSRALSSVVGDWTPARLDAYLANTEAFVPGTSMFYEMPDRAQRKALIAYLQTLK